jgi:hypothetical protein
MNELIILFTHYQCGDDEVRLVLDKHADLDLNSASSLKQESAGS